MQYGSRDADDTDENVVAPASIRTRLRLPSLEDSEERNDCTSFPVSAAFSEPVTLASTTAAESLLQIDPVVRAGAAEASCSEAQTAPGTAANAAPAPPRLRTVKVCHLRNMQSGAEMSI